MRTSPASGRRPAELDDAAWLRRALGRVGTRAIADELGVSRGTVIRACERLGVRLPPPGRRRGVTVRSIRAPDPSVKPAMMRIAARFSREQSKGAPGTLSLVAARVHALHEANTAGDPLAIEDALEALGSASGLMLDHLQRLRAA